MRLLCRIFGHRDRVIPGSPGVWCTRCWTMPEGVTIGVDYGQEFAVAATVEVQEDGRVKVLSIENVAYPSEVEES